MKLICKVLNSTIMVQFFRRSDIILEAYQGNVAYWKLEALLWGMWESQDFILSELSIFPQVELHLK